MQKKFIENKSLVVLSCVAILSLMSGLVYASPTLYQIFCDVTGFGGKPQKVELASYYQDVSAGKKIYKEITIRFDANNEPGLPVKFYPLEKQVKVKIGDKILSYYMVENNSSKKITTMAVYNMEPQGMAQYFNKIECFCFTQQSLAPNEKKKMPILYYIDPDLLQDEDFASNTEVTMSYTLYRGDE